MQNLPMDSDVMFVEDVLQVIQIGTDIGTVAHKGMVRQTPGGGRTKK